ncbi:MAG: M23 family metallopeptidase [Lachnospiraceae bacterium]|nr:M23 family metallopeptidase [Lachnospiraceae bacterium]MBR4993501.1 M23 family metallopeptidase [Lachnospiraceae bacterium]
MDDFFSKKHKQKKTRYIVFTTNEADGEVKQIKLNNGVYRFLVIIFCVILGAMIGFGIYEGRIYDFFAKQSIEHAKQIEELSLDKAQLEMENESLNEKITLLSETLNSKVEAENALNSEMEQMHVPTEFPLTGSAQAKETDTISAIADMLFEATGAVIQHPGQVQATGDPIVVFKTEEGSTVVAAGSGTVILVDEDVNYGNQVVIDHGNGYITYYLNEGTPKVKEGDEVTQGDLIYVIGSDNTTLGYQIKKDDAYINPMDLISISG